MLRLSAPFHIPDCRSLHVESQSIQPIRNDGQRVFMLSTFLSAGWVVTSEVVHQVVSSVVNITLK